MKLKLNKIIANCAILSAVGFMANAQAAGTLAGTSISNTANLAFSISGVSQTPVASNTVSFIVDNKIQVVVVNDNAGVPTNASPGGTGFVHKFKVTNTGNATQDYILQANSTGFAGQTVLTKIDNFDVTGCIVRAESTASGTTYESATDTADFIDELAPDASKEVYVICSTPIAQVNNDFAAISLKATTANSGSAGNLGFQVGESGGANTAGIDIVFGDVAGTDDANRDGAHSARGGFLIKAPKLTIVKTNTLLCDPINFKTNPKNIPGAFVEYYILITNAADAGASANLGILTDTIDFANLTFDPNYIKPNATSCSPSSPPTNGVGRGFAYGCDGAASPRACRSARRYSTGAADSDGFTYDDATGTVTIDFSVPLPVQTGYEAGELKAGEIIGIIFNVQVK